MSVRMCLCGYGRCDFVRLYSRICCKCQWLLFILELLEKQLRELPGEGWLSGRVVDLNARGLGLRCECGSGRQ